MSSLSDPAKVREEYTSERGLAARASVYEWAEGADAVEVAVQAVLEVAPERVLDAGCGRGDKAERVARELGAAVVGLDQSERMVQLTWARGVPAVLGDVRELPFPDGTFDCVLAAWMLYHVPDVGQALSEFARVLRSGGRLVAVTNGLDHMRELYELLGVERPSSTFSAENGEALLERNFARVERRDASGWVVFPNHDAAQKYVDATISLFGRGRQLPPLEGSLRVTRAPYIFVADK